ncbi:MAG: bifunctional aminodeoxychorismate synthase component I/aminodeoxychorismate lyase, partial [Polynucleobacter sp. 39-46-10]
MILLDDAQSSHAAPSSRLYEKVLQCWTIYPQTKSSETIAAVDECLKSINMALARGEYVVAAFAYELGLYIHQIERRPAEEMKLHPLVQAWSFKSYESLSKEDVDKFIRNRIAALEPDSQISGVASLNFSIDEEQFTSDIEIIQE